MKRLITALLLIGLVATSATADIVKDEFGCSENSQNIKELKRVIAQGLDVWSLEQLHNFKVQLKSALIAREAHVCGTIRRE